MCPFVEHDQSKGRYETYLDRVKQVAQDTCGFVVEREYLRMPSTKNVCLMGRRRRYGPDDKTSHSEYVSQVVDLTRATAFVPRVSDADKEKLRRERKSRLEAAAARVGAAMEMESDPGPGAELDPHLMPDLDV
ncbi:tRNA methyltransferase 44 [Gonapodya sp. JEL0774]|nr:tRNA methyltransferase 44 [Gonapodya sp. JEL0774]